jgi:Bacterial PH domain
MSYIQESLAPNEKLIYRAHFHWLRKAQACVPIAASLVVAAASLALLQGSLAALGTALALAIGLVFFVAMMMPIWTTEIGVTNHRFIFKRGWLRRRTDELQLSAIEEVNLRQGVLGRIFNYGRLVLHGTGVNDISLPPLADPVGLRRALQEGMGAAKATVVVEPDIADRTPRASAVAIHEVG